MMTAVQGFPRRGWVGMLLIAIGWPLAWCRPAGWQFFWENSFFLLWLGYVLVVDGLNWKRSGSSLFARSPRAFAGLFLLSIPGWWLFEFFNRFLQNWHYLLNRPVSPLEYGLRASVHFSVVIPAVLSTAEWWRSSSFTAGFQSWRRLPVSRGGMAACICLGVAMLAAVMLFPRYCFPFVWVALFLVFDAFNFLRGSPSLFRFLSRGNWRPVLDLALGALICGFFWEMWNYYALPKWVYTVPFVDVLHVFEMPILGYLGYLPFGLEVYALYILLIDITGLKKTSLYGGDEFVKL
ncbi:MAG: hypothetical protein DRH04_06255 [Deltaproteobacteria bacterium]|nr:MAG: hypothetical protein DRH04_06255 [Deltaproteobacteria bacterium]